MATDSKFDVEIRGVRPLILHSDNGIDPFHPMVKEQKEITGQKKTKDLEQNVRRVEWLKYAVSFYGGLDDAPFVPSDNLLKAFSEAGFDVKKSGKKEVLSGVDVVEDEVELLYEGPKTPRAMFEHVVNGGRPFVFSKSVRIPPRTGSRVPSSRPRIPSGWRMRFTVVRRNFCALSDDELRRVIAAAGNRVGLCDWRPRYGLYEVVTFQEAKD